MESVFCQQCHEKQSPHWQRGQLCQSCGGEVKPQLHCGWCSELGPRGRYCRHCGFEHVDESLYPVARMLKHAGVDRLSLYERIQGLSDTEREKYRALYNMQYRAVVLRVDEMLALQDTAVLRSHAAGVHDHLLKQLPVDEQLLATLSAGEPLAGHEPMEQLRLILQQSPIPQTQWLARIAFLKMAPLAEIQKQGWEVLKGLLEGLGKLPRDIEIEVLALLAHWRTFSSVLCPETFLANEATALARRALALLNDDAEREELEVAVPERARIWLAALVLRCENYASLPLSTAQQQRLRFQAEKGLHRFDDDGVLSMALCLNDPATAVGLFDSGQSWRGRLIVGTVASLGSEHVAPFLQHEDPAVIAIVIKHFPDQGADLSDDFKQVLRDWLGHDEALDELILQKILADVAAVSSDEPDRILAIARRQGNETLVYQLLAQLGTMHSADRPVVSRWVDACLTLIAEQFFTQESLHRLSECSFNDRFPPALMDRLVEEGWEWQPSDSEQATARQWCDLLGGQVERNQSASQFRDAPLNDDLVSKLMQLATHMLQQGLTELCLPWVDPLWRYHGPALHRVISADEATGVEFLRHFMAVRSRSSGIAWVECNLFPLKRYQWPSTVKCLLAHNAFDASAMVWLSVAINEQTDNGHGVSAPVSYALGWLIHRLLDLALTRDSFAEGGIATLIDTGLMKEWMRVSKDESWSFTSVYIRLFLEALARSADPQAPVRIFFDRIKDSPIDRGSSCDFDIPDAEGYQKDILAQLAAHTKLIQRIREHLESEDDPLGPWLADVFLPTLAEQGAPMRGDQAVWLIHFLARRSVAEPDPANRLQRLKRIHGLIAAQGRYNVGGPLLTKLVLDSWGTEHQHGRALAEFWVKNLFKQWLRRQPEGAVQCLKDLLDQPLEAPCLRDELESFLFFHEALVLEAVAACESLTQVGLVRAFLWEQPGETQPFWQRSSMEVDKLVRQVLNDHPALCAPLLEGIISDPDWLYMSLRKAIGKGLVAFLPVYSEDGDWAERVNGHMLKYLCGFRSNDLHLGLLDLVHAWLDLIPQRQSLLTEQQWDSLHQAVTTDRVEARFREKALQALGCECEACTRLKGRGGEPEITKGDSVPSEDGASAVMTADAIARLTGCSLEQAQVAHAMAMGQDITGGDNGEATSSAVVTESHASEESTGQTPNFCPFCGTGLPSVVAIKFCPSCGQALRQRACS